MAKPNTKGHDEDEDEDEDESDADTGKSDKQKPSASDSPDAYEDDSEDEDNEDDDDSDGGDDPATKGVGDDDEQEVAVVDGEEVLKAITDAASSAAETAVYDAVEKALPALVAAFLTDDEVLAKVRGIVGGRINKGFTDHIQDLTAVTERLEKALTSGAALVKGVQDASDEEAKTTPAPKTVSAEVLDKGIGVGDPAEKPADVDALLKEALDLQVEKGIAIPVLGDYLGLDIASRHAPDNIAALQKGIAHAKTL